MADLTTIPKSFWYRPDKAKYTRAKTVGQLRKILDRLPDDLVIGHRAEVFVGSSNQMGWGPPKEDNFSAYIG